MAGKFKSMFLEVFFKFLSNFGDNFVKNARKFQSYLGESTRKIKNLGRIVRYFGIVKKIVKKIGGQELKNI